MVVSVATTPYGILEAINKTSDKKVIWLKKKHPHLLDGVELKEKYKVFPQLKELAYQLVDLKLSNPEISDLDRLTIVLENFKNKNIEKAQGYTPRAKGEQNESYTLTRR